MAIHPGQGQAAFISKAERVAEAALATQGLLCFRPWRSGFCAWDSTWTAELASGLLQGPYYCLSSLAWLSYCLRTT